GRRPEKATRAKAPGCERYVPTPMCFGKGRERSFRDFMTAKRAISGRNRPATELLQEVPRKPSLVANEQGDTHDGYIRFCSGRRWLRRLCGREPSLRGSRHVGGAAGSRRRVQQLDRHLTRRDDPDDLGQG